MTDEVRYKVGVFTVEMTVEHGVPMECSCDCEEFAENQQNMMKSLDEKKCRHIREAEMFHHFEKKVESID